MLFIAETEYARLKELMDAAHTGDPEAAARRAIEFRPTFAPAWMLLATSVKDPAEAEAAFRRVLWLHPCRNPPYLSLAEFLTSRNEGDATAKRLRHLAMWKLSFAETVPDYIAEHFAAVLGPEASEPETYECLAMAQEIEFSKAPEAPGITAFLRPYRLLNRLQVEAPDQVEESTLRDILLYRDECEPLLRNALREWAHRHEALDEDTLDLLIAILGEISGPDLADDLLELCGWGDESMFRHVHWALLRLDDRHPKEMLERYRAAAGGIWATRCAIAEHLLLMMPADGDIEVLHALLDGFESFRSNKDAPFLLAATVEALVARGGKEAAEAMVARHAASFSKRDRTLVREALRGDYLPMLVMLEIQGHTIEEVCLERALMDEPEDEDEEFGEDEWDEPLDVEPPPRPERNDPCWCGSGKKYKKCHMTADEDADRKKRSATETDEPVSLHAALLSQVLEASGEWHRDSDLRRAKKMYFGESGPIEADESALAGFLQWLVHDFRDAATRRTAIEHYLRTRESTLSPAERALLESLRDARFGLYEAERVEPGSGVGLRDIFTDDRMFVHDISASTSLHRWDCLLVRLQFHEGRWIMAGDGTVVPRNLLESLRESLERESLEAGQAPAEFVRANSHRLHRVVKDLHSRQLDGLRVVNNEDEEVRFGTSEYAVSDPAALLGKLRAVDELEEDRSAENPTFIWVQAAGKGKRPLGTVAVTGDALRLEAMSRTRLETLRGLVEFHAGALLTHRSDHYTSIDEIKERSKRGEWETAPPRPPSPEEREAIGAMLAEHYAHWVDESLPALGGKTARQALRSRSGRQKVIDLLRLMENQEQRQPPESGPKYDFNIIRRQLGLPEE